MIKLQTVSYMNNTHIPGMVMWTVLARKKKNCSIVSRSLQPDGLCRMLGFSVHGILQARILEWVAVPSSRASSPAGDRIQLSLIAGRFPQSEPPGKPLVEAENKYVK